MGRLPSEKEIIASKKEKRPYGVKVEFKSFSELDIEGRCTLMFKEDIIVEIEPLETHRELDQGKKWMLRTMGFPTAGKAEEAGHRVTLALLWATMQNKWPVRLLYQTPLPYQVFLRTQDQVEASIKGYATVTKSLTRIINQMDRALQQEIEFNGQLLVALELFNAAAHETTERAKFVMTMSSVEALLSRVDRTQHPEYGLKMQTLLSNLKSLVRDSEGIPESVRGSIVGSIDNQLRWRSISQSLKKLCEKYLPGDSQSYQILRDCYNIRSTIVHEGGTDDFLSEKATKLSEITRQIFASVIGLPLN